MSRRVLGGHDSAAGDVSSLIIQGVLLGDMKMPVEIIGEAGTAGAER